MKLTTLFLALVLATGATRGEWVEQGKTALATHYVDLPAPGRSGDFAKVWTMQSLHNKVGPVHSLRALFEYDCVKKLERRLQVSAFPEPMLGGHAISNSNLKEDWKDIPPRTPGEAFLEIACT